MTDAPRPLGATDFFALEAGEYLERLDGLVGRPDAGTAGEELVRLARALRGSALMANRQPIARAAAGLEALARAAREGTRAWDEATRQLAIRAVDDLKIFVRRAPEWNEGDTAKAEALAATLDQAAGRTSTQVRAAEAMGLDAGARAFVAREGAAIASALDRASHALRANPQAQDPLQIVLKALQPLRGLAAVNDLPPLPDLLDGIERAAAELAGGTSRRGGAPDLFQAAATAIANAARGVAERGRPDPESAEFKRFATLLLGFLDAEPGVVSVSSLYFDDTGPHVMERGAAAAPSATLGRLELVSHGEHLRQAADSLERAPSNTQRELRAHTLAGTFRSLAAVGGGPLADQVAAFAAAARDAVSGGIAAAQPGPFATELRRAADVLVRSATDDEAALATHLAEVTTGLRALAKGGVTPAPSPAARPAVAAAPVPETPDLPGSWVAYERLVAGGVGPAALDDLLAGGGGGGGGAARAPAPRAPAAPAPVDIRTLLYRGQRALQHAQELRQEAQHATGDRLRALVDEVCDLVALALEPGD
ncbi:MAG TPA: hypothetical protein VF978_06515 [Gemmatimonadales bacterium]